MFRLLILALTFFGFISSSASQAEQIPGIDDPALSVAAEQWLAEVDPLDALRDIGSLAAAGNIAAQFFANQVFHSLSAMDDLTRPQRLDLFPRSPQDGRRARFSPYQIDAKLAPALAARSAIRNDMNPADWIALTEAMLAADMRQTALDNIGFALQVGSLNVEVLEFATDHLAPADPQITDYWISLILEIHRRKFFDRDEAHIARWSDEPWELLRRTGFFAAVEEGLWPALLAGMFTSDATLEEFKPFERLNIDVARRLFVAAHGQDDFDPSHYAEDISELGRLVLGSVEQTPYLRPLVVLCSEKCPDDHAQCVVAGLLNGFGKSHVARRLEPVIPAKTYYASSRAIDEVRSNLAARLNGQVMQRALMPQCMLNAAR